jgi:hypothetical protein
MARSFSWVQPICTHCWAERYPDREGRRIEEARLEKCAFCGVETKSGIYIRMNPKFVRFPVRKGKHG